MALILLVLALASYALAAVFYSRHLSGVFGLDPKEITAVKNNDGRDYVPTRTPIVFAHHFASIAAAEDRSLLLSHLREDRLKDFLGSLNHLSWGDGFHTDGPLTATPFL